MRDPADRSELERGRPRERLIHERYRVISFLGEGSTGRVYLAHDLASDRPVALKMVRPDRRGDPKIAARFVREAHAVGRIESPHVVRLYDWGRDDGELYLAMELLEGQCLVQRLRSGPALDVADAVRIGASVARGLRAAHEAGILHRDLKPGNVFLCEDGSVKVLDFGLAKLLDDPSIEPLTRPHRILGTPVYMSPEAARHEELGPTADLYALGILLFEMVSGEPPFKTGDALATMQAHLTRPVPRLRDAASWTHVPPELDELVASLLIKEPRRRPRDAGEVALALDRIAEQVALEATVRERRDSDTTHDARDDWSFVASWERAVGERELRIDDEATRPMPPIEPATVPELPSLRRAWPWKLVTAIALALFALVLVWRAFG